MLMIALFDRLIARVAGAERQLIKRRDTKIIVPPEERPF
jgi:hypothetical protein